MRRVTTLTIRHVHFCHHLVTRRRQEQQQRWLCLQIFLNFRFPDLDRVFCRRRFALDFSLRVQNTARMRAEICIMAVGTKNARNIKVGQSVGSSCF